MLSTIRLFKALPIEAHTDNQTLNEDISKLTLPKGFLFTPDVVAAYTDPSYLIDQINKVYGRSTEELNQTFHKSFAKVRDASMRQLVFEQMIHYLTTYGAEHMGIYSSDSVYIPGEALEAPELKDGTRLVVIRGLTTPELKLELMKLLTSGVALHESTLSDAIDVAQYVGLTPEDVGLVKNKEAKAALYDHFGIVPQNPIEFLRFVVYKATNKTLLIKNAEVIAAIKSRDNTDITRYFDIYEREVGLHRLAEIFNRYKPIFLAFRTNTRMKQTINRIRRQARVYHQPMAEDALNSVTAHLKNQGDLDPATIETSLRDATVFRKIRLAYALKFRTTDADSILYRVRNGKSYATSFKFDNKTGAKELYDTTLRSIIEDVRPNVEGKKIFIPKGLVYALPATEKQFTGNLPTGTYVEVLEDTIFGVHWDNQGTHRIDLDMSVTNADGKIGWDAGYRNSEQGIYFSGDITDAPAPLGASELFHVSGRARGSWLLNVNYYNFDESVPVPFKIVVGQESRENIEKNHTIDPNKIVALSNSEMAVKQKILGIIVSEDKSTKFYFAESNMGRAITAGSQPYSEQARKYLLNYYTDAVSLNDVLIAAGADLVEDETVADINLSSEVVDKTTILELLSYKEADKLEEGVAA